MDQINHHSPEHVDTVDPARRLTVNRVTFTDTSVVISWNQGRKREAEGMTPAEARRMATALIAAADLIDPPKTTAPRFAQKWCASCRAGTCGYHV